MTPRSTPHGRTLAADLCPDWQHDGREYTHPLCPGFPPGTIRFAPPGLHGGHVRTQDAECRGCGQRWHRFQSRWEKQGE